MVGGRSEPEVPVEVARRFPRRRQVARLRHLAVAPGARLLQLPDRAVQNQFPHPVEILVLVPLGAQLGRDLVPVLEVIGADDARFLDAVGERFLAVHVMAAVDRPVGHERMHVVRRAHDHRVDVLLVERVPPVDVSLRPGELPRRLRQALLVDVAERDDVLVLDRLVMRQGPAPDADQRDVQLLARRVRPEEAEGGKNQQARPGGGRAGEEGPAFHGMTMGKAPRSISRFGFTPACSSFRPKMSTLLRPIATRS
jgi:hypothetical protein